MKEMNLINEPNIKFVIFYSFSGSSSLTVDEPILHDPCASRPTLCLSVNARKATVGNADSVARGCSLLCSVSDRKEVFHFSHAENIGLLMEDQRGDARH